MLIGSLLSFTLIGCGSSNDDQTTDNHHFPTSVDSAEAGSGDNTEDNATPAQLNSSYEKTNFPAGDVDWVSIQLTEGITYELTANAICPTCDTEMYLSEKEDGQYNNIDDNDDRNNGYDSGIVFTPSRTDTYYVKVIALDDNGITSYTLNIHEYIDNDEDDFSTFFDCNDSDASIYPFAEEIAEDSIDQDCNGSDLIAETTPDRFEDDNTFDKATSVLFLEHYYTESIHFFQQFKDEMHSHHDMNDIDWLKATLPAHSAANFSVNDYLENNSSFEFFEIDGETAAYFIAHGETEETLINYDGEYSLLVNTSDIEKTYLIKVSTSSPDTGVYMPYLEFIGFDLDKDGFYSMDWAWKGYDCDDENADINPDENDVEGDEIDQDCDGDDDSQNNNDGPF